MMFEILDFSRSRHHQLSVLNAAQTQHAVGELLQITATPLHDDDLQTVVVVQMYMGGCKYLVVGVVLNFYELVGEIRAVMIIDHR